MLQALPDIYLSRLEKFPRGKSSSLFGHFISNEEKSFRTLARGANLKNILFVTEEAK
jgi:hypothetical protein